MHGFGRRLTAASFMQMETMGLGDLEGHGAFYIGLVSRVRKDNAMRRLRR